MSTALAQRPAAAGAGPHRRGTGVAHRLPAAEAVVLLLAVAARLAVVLRRPGGLHGLFGYDSGVYFAGADSLIHGRLPYRDYVQLHPPGITVALTPFALLTKIMSDPSAFAVTIVSFTVLGGVNAVLVVRLCRRLDLGTAGAVVGGCFYALWAGSVGAEYIVKLEPLANLCLLGGLLLALRAERAATRSARCWPSFLAGAPLGYALGIKIWWVVPVLAVVVWHALRCRSRRAGLALLGGAASAAVVLMLPFFLAAPRRMWAMVVTDQLTRQRASASGPLVRLADLSTVTRLGHLPGTEKYALLAVGVVVTAAAVVSAWRIRIARAAVALVALQLAVLLTAPSWFPYYCDYLAVGAAVVVGAAASRSGATSSLPARAARLPGAVAVTAAAAVTVVALTASHLAAAPFVGGARLRQAVAHVPCVMSDSPAAQIELDALSRGLAAGCPNWVDVTGPTYGPDRSSHPRVRNTRWQRDLVAYLRRGQAAIVVRGPASGVSPAVLRALARDGALARAGGHTVWRTRAARLPRPARPMRPVRPTRP